MRRHAKATAKRRDDGPVPKSNRAEAAVPAAKKVKGAVQMAAGTALAVVGVPMCILPGPGVAAIAGGVALASRGQRTYSGRSPSRLERRLDAAAEKATAAAKEQMGRAVQAAAREAPRAAGAAARAVGHGVIAVTSGVATLAAKGARAVGNQAQS